MTAEDVTCGGCSLVTRRGFVSQATLAAVAAVLAGCGGGGDGGGSTGPVVTTPPRPPQIPTPLVVTLANFPVLANVGGAARVSSQPLIALARTSAGIVGYSLDCTHAGSPVDIRSNFTLKCPNHGAEFAFDGTWTGGEQRTTSLLRVTVTPNASGTLVTIG
ncbi:MAG: Rieske 2Fe-2S domain-containing protein [Gemmatimonadaceae bacterium]|nr:Rieske 2Fe-2S domain-containing protein [Gemmatimonadaceae bacterium]